MYVLGRANVNMGGVSLQPFPWDDLGAFPKEIGDFGAKALRRRCGSQAHEYFGGYSKVTLFDHRL